MAGQSSRVTAHDAIIKIEEIPLYPTSTPAPSAQTIERHSMSSVGKRKRTSMMQYVDLDLESETETVSHRVKVEKSSNPSTNEPPKSNSQAKKAPVGHYREICRQFQNEFANLADPKRIPDKILLESYKRSRDLNVFMKAEYDEKHGEFVKLREARTQLNGKIKSLKTASADAKEAAKAAEIRAKLHENNYREANLQLTLKLAQPLSHAQIKFENVQQDYAMEMADLRAKLMEERNAKESALKYLAVAQSEIAQTAAEVDMQTPEMARELHELRGELDDLQKSRAICEASAKESATKNLHLLSKTRDLEAKIASLKADLETANWTTAAETAERKIAQKAVEVLKKQVQEQDAKLKEQSTVFAAFEDARKLFHST